MTSLAGAGRAPCVTAESLDSIPEPGDPLHKGLETGVADSDSNAPGGSGCSVEGTGAGGSTEEAEATVTVQ